MAVLSQVPFQTKVTEANRVLGKYWSFWMQQLRTRLNLCPERVGLTSLTAQVAAISATAVRTSKLHTGLYRVSYYARITTAATTSSSLTLTLGWTDRAVVVSHAGAAMTGNTTATTQSGTLFLQVDSASAITYTVAYVSSGATGMQYALDIMVEEIRP